MPLALDEVRFGIVDAQKRHLGLTMLTQTEDYWPHEPEEVATDDDADQTSRGLAAYPGAPHWLVYPWESSFADTCRRMRPQVRQVVKHVGRDEARREVVVLRVGDDHLQAADAEALSQQALCSLDDVAKAIGWTKPVKQKMFRMSVVVDCSTMTISNWLPCVRCLVSVIKSIQPFVSPFYDRLPGLISIVDPPSVVSAAWMMIRPLLGKPTRDVVQFVTSGETSQ